MQSSWKSYIVKFGFSFIGCAGAVLHIVKPLLKIDSITIGLLVFATLPWISSFVSSLKFPGGWEIAFKDVAAAAAKVDHAPLSLTAGASTSSLPRLETTDPNLALVSLRIDIEKGLRALATARGVPSTGPLTVLLETLRAQGYVPSHTARGLKTLIAYGNQAAHGATVDPKIAKLAQSMGVDLIGRLQFPANHKGEATENPEARVTS